MNNDAFRFVRDNDETTARVFCFHYAGGSALFYADMHRYLSDDVGVYPYQLPGRLDRAGEEFADSIWSVAENAADIISGYSDKPIILTGHSMGGIIGFDTAYILKEKYSIDVAKLYITASLPSLSAVVNRTDAKTDDLDDDEFCKALKDFGAIDERALKIREFYQIFLPVVRADFRMIENYSDDESRKISADIEVYGGDNDKIIDSGSLSLWKNRTSGKTDIFIRQGDHFFIKNCKAEVYGSIDRFIHKGINT